MLLSRCAVVETTADEQGYTRHHVKDEDYPGLIEAKHMALVDEYEFGLDLTDHSDETTRGTLVSGLNEKDIRLLDIFEGDEYTRKPVEIALLGEPCQLSHLPPSIADPTQRTDAAEIGTASAETYIWTASYKRLDQKAWK